MRLFGRRSSAAPSQNQRSDAADVVHSGKSLEDLLPQIQLNHDEITPPSVMTADFFLNMHDMTPPENVEMREKFRLRAEEARLHTQRKAREAQEFHHHSQQARLPTPASSCSSSPSSCSVPGAGAATASAGAGESAGNDAAGADRAARYVALHARLFEGDADAGREFHRAGVETKRFLQRS